MNLSYWEYNSWFDNIDFTVVGSGIVGLSCALRLRERFPKARILVLEKGILPQGASTRNAGFACFGSVSELLADLERHSEEEVRQLVSKRYEGILFLRNQLGDAAIGYQQHGGYEVFLEDEREIYEHCLDKIAYLNQLLKPVFGDYPFKAQTGRLNLKRVQGQMIAHRYEGQLDTGRMMQALLEKARTQDIQVLNGLAVDEFDLQAGRVRVKTANFEFDTGQFLVATNGFASQLLREEVVPARAQVLITAPIKDLTIKGTFHLNQGYYYFRNVDNRLLLGGGRNLDFEGETTVEFGSSPKIQQRLEWLLKEVILPDTPFEIERRWSGIMGVGGSKLPIIRRVSEKVYCGVRLGGMGIAIGSLVGRELADIVDGNRGKNGYIRAPFTTIL